MQCCFDKLNLTVVNAVEKKLNVFFFNPFEISEYELVLPEDLTRLLVFQLISVFISFCINDEFYQLGIIFIMN